jgi:glycosyltransferase involved in cell wall biosynthesis
MARVRRRPAAAAPEPIDTVCMFGHYAPTYVRNQQVHAALTALGHPVLHIQSDGPVRRRWPQLVREARGKKFDVVWVAFLGYSDVPLAWLLSKRRRVPLVFDAFVLLHDTFVTDRGTVRTRSLTSFFMRALEIVACHLADIVVVDTVDHAERVAQRTRLDPARIRVLHVGSEHVDPCPPAPAAPPGSPFTVTFCGSFMPLHGVDVIVRAAALLRDEPAIRFVLVGDGQTKPEAVDLANRLGCENVTFLDPCHGPALRDLLCRAAVLLGVFGTSAKAMVVVPNKVVDALALAKPIVTAGTPAIRRALDASQLAMVPPGDPRSLADAILALYSDPDERERLGRAGRAAYEAGFSPAVLRVEMAAILDAAVSVP